MMLKVFNADTGMLITSEECYLTLMLVEQDLLIPAGINYIVTGEDDYDLIITEKDNDDI